MLYLLSLFSVASAQLWWNSTSCEPELTNRGFTVADESFQLSSSPDLGTFNLKVFYPDESDSQGRLPLIAVLPDLGVPTSKYYFRASQLAQNGFVAYVVDYYGTSGVDETTDLSDNAPYLTKVVKASLKHMEGYGDNTQDKQNVLGFGFGGELVWSMEFTDWWGTTSEGINAGAAIGSEELVQRLDADDNPTLFPFFYVCGDNCTGWSAKVAELFEDSSLQYTWGGSAFADSTPGFQNHGTDTYVPCPAELAFSSSLQWITRVLGENHEAFYQSAAIDSTNSGGINPNEIAPKGALVALGVLCGLVLFCIICYSYYPEDFSE